MVHVQQSYRKKSFVILHPHTTKFTILNFPLARKVKMRWVNCKLHLVVVKVKPLKELRW